MSLRELKGRLVLALGEALADKLWCRLLESRLLDDISSLQRGLEGDACGRLAAIALAVAAEGEAPEGPQARALLGAIAVAARGLGRPAGPPPPVPRLHSAATAPCTGLAEASISLPAAAGREIGRPGGSRRRRLACTTVT